MEERIESLSSDLDALRDLFELKLKDFEVSGTRITRLPPEEPFTTLEVDDLNLHKHTEEYYTGDQMLSTHVHATYHPTYPFEGEYINDTHVKISVTSQGDKLDWDIPGYLRVSEAMKVYEMSCFSKGDVLQLGTFKGLSTDLIYQALIDSRVAGRRLDTVDVDAETTAMARQYIEKKRGGLGPVTLHLCGGTEFMDQQIIRRKQYGFIFIDHCHWYRQTYTATTRVCRLLQPGGFVLFHDYKEHVNFDPKHPYTVMQAVNDALMPDPRFAYWGVFGSAALFRFLPSDGE